MNHIAYCLDRNYTQHLCVSIASLARYNTGFQLWLIHDGMEESARAFIKEMSDSFHFSIQEIVADGQTFSDLTLSKGITHSTYYRLMLPELLPAEVDRLLYFDADLIVQSRLDALFDVDLEGKFLAAVEDAGYKGQDLPLADEQTPYFNSGVMLINLNMWRQFDIKERTCAFVSENHEIIRFSDQCGLNAIVNGRWHPIHPKFNLQSFHFKNKWGNKLYTDDCIRAAIKRPSIIHYSGEIKPWSYLSRHHYKNVYWNYLKQTPYKHFKTNDRNLKNFFKKWLPPAIKRFLKRLLDKCFQRSRR